MIQLDLGCGGAARQHEGVTEYVGIDINPTSKGVIKMDLAIHPIPLKDDRFDLVTAYDFLEHIPHVVYLPERRQCLIELFNEIYRVLKHNGTFYTQTPIKEFNDPTHVSFWTQDSFNYFSGDYFGWHDHYGHTSRFEKVSAHEENNHVYATLRAIKDLPKDHPYQINY